MLGTVLVMILLVLQYMRTGVEELAGYRWILELRKWCGCDPERTPMENCQRRARRLEGPSNPSSTISDRIEVEGEIGEELRRGGGQLAKHPPS